MTRLGGSNRYAQIVNAIGAALFALSAALQHNDPDPLPWMALYGVAALACLLWRRWRHGGVLAALVAVVALGWALAIAAELPFWVEPARLLSSAPMRGGPVEMEREIGGLAIVAAWMLALALSARRRSAGPNRL